MQIAPPVGEPSTRTVQRDRERIRYAAIGAAGPAGGHLAVLAGGLVDGLVMLDLGVRPRDPNGLSAFSPHRSRMHRLRI